MSKPLLFAFCILSCEIARSYCTAFSSKHTDIRNFPHHVSLRRDGQHVCSGAIVSASYILTAASCIYDPYPTLNASRYTVLMGSAKLVDPPSNAIILPVLELLPNPNFHHYTLFCDLALVKVDALEFLMSDKSVARPLFLPETKFYEMNDGQQLKTTGWKKLLDGTGKFDPQLSVTGAKIVNSSYCIKGMLPYHTYSYRKLCAGYTLENQQTCQGDVGAPLIHNDVIVGVMSIPTGCHTSKFPGVYTQVTKFLTWLQRVVNPFDQISTVV